jgi:hypothetical protein
MEADRVRHLHPHRLFRELWGGLVHGHAVGGLTCRFKQVSISLHVVSLVYMSVCLCTCLHVCAPLFLRQGAILFCFFMQLFNLCDVY